MVAAVCPDTLAPLVERLDALTHRASVEQLRDWLEGLQIDVEDVSRFVRFGEKNYLRNLVRGGEWYHLLVICWRSGHRSPIHNHAQSTCGFRVLTGVATETRFEFSPSGLIKAASSRDFVTGEVISSQDADIHQVSNLQTADRDLITLHIYSPPLLRMDTYSLTDRKVEEYRPFIFEYAMGGGI